MHRLVIAAIAVLVALGLPTAQASAAVSGAKVVVVVGPVADHNAHYISDAHAIAAEARKYSSNVVEIDTPRATWARVKAAAQGASVFVYLGHGNGWPSPYPPFRTATQDGLGLDPNIGADGSAHVYYGEDYIRANIRFAPNAVVLLYHLCYASGNSEPGLAEGTLTTAKQRVDNYGAGFIGAGARAVFAEGHPAHPVVDYIRQLFTTNRTMDQIFRTAPTFHNHILGAYPSQRTPGLRYELDPESSSSNFYRSLVGDFGLPASAVRAAPPASSGVTPPDFVVPGAAEVVDDAGAAKFATAAAAADPAGKANGTFRAGTHLRVTAEAAPMPDGTRVLAVKVIGGTATGFVRTSGLAPRDSAATAIWTFDQSASWLSPNGDGNNERFAVAARLSETAMASAAVRDAAGHTVWRGTQAGDMIGFGWDLKTATGATIPDGVYTWTFSAHDGWGNPGVSRSGSFTVDRTPPVTRAAASSTAGKNGWSVSPVSVRLAATDARSGVAGTWWRLGSGTVRAYSAPVVVSADGTWSFGFRSADRAGVGEAWRTLTLKIDRTAPVITIALGGTRSAVPGTWRSAVAVKPAVKDATSGIAAASVSVDGGRPAALGAAPVVVSGDGSHTVRVDATDVAGNRASASATFTIDATPPVVTLPTAPAAPPTVTPNGDGRTDTIALPYTVSEAGTVQIAVVAPDGKTVVRTVLATVAAGPQQFVWDGRNNVGVRVPDGRYTVAFTPTDLPGNTGAVASEPVDVYAALASIAATPGLFFPQDGDALASRTAVAFKLLSPAKVSIAILDASGRVVRTPFSGKAYPAGAVSWLWNGKADDGKFVPQGRYRVVVTATNGTQAASLVQGADAMAFRLAASVASPVRGAAFTLTATSAEPLVAPPVVTVRQPGLAAWSMRMTRVSATRFTVTITPRRGGAAGQISLSLAGVDTARGINRSVLLLALR